MPAEHRSSSLAPPLQCLFITPARPGTALSAGSGVHLAPWPGLGVSPLLALMKGPHPAGAASLRREVLGPG